MSSSAERFLKLDWSAERKRKNRSERGAPIFFQFSHYFPDFTTKFSQSISKKKRKKRKKKERWKPTGALTADQKCDGAPVYFLLFFLEIDRENFMESGKKIGAPRSDLFFLLRSALQSNFRNRSALQDPPGPPKSF